MNIFSNNNKIEILTQQVNDLTERIEKLEYILRRYPPPDNPYFNIPQAMPYTPPNNINTCVSGDSKTVFESSRTLINANAFIIANPLDLTKRAPEHSGTVLPFLNGGSHTYQYTNYINQNGINPNGINPNGINPSDINPTAP